MKYIVISLLATLVLTLPVNYLYSEENKHEGHDDHAGEKTIKLSAKVMKEFSINTRYASSGSIAKLISVPGEIVINKNSLTHISVRFPGILQKTLKNIGDFVAKGDLLAIVNANESLIDYKIKALSSGTVIETHATMGEFLSSEDIIFTIADLSSVWVNLTIYQADINHINIGQDVLILIGHTGISVEGKIDYISPLINETTRAAVARVTLKKVSKAFRPGTFVNATISLKEQPVPIRILNSAIQTIDGKPSVFVKTDDGFEVRNISIGLKDNTYSEVLLGLNFSEEYVYENSFTLKSELAKSSFEDGHNH